MRQDVAHNMTRLEVGDWRREQTVESATQVALSHCYSNGRTRTLRTHGQPLTTDYLASPRRSSVPADEWTA